MTIFRRRGKADQFLTTVVYGNVNEPPRTSIKCVYVALDTRFVQNLSGLDNSVRGMSALCLHERQVAEVHVDTVSETAAANREA